MQQVGLGRGLQEGDSPRSPSLCRSPHRCWPSLLSTHPPCGKSPQPLRPSQDFWPCRTPLSRKFSVTWQRQVLPAPTPTPSPWLQTQGLAFRRPRC